MAYDHTPFTPVREFVQNCIAFGCPENDFDILACTSPQEVSKLLRDKLSILAEEFKETQDATHLACEQLAVEGRVSVEVATELFDGLLDVIFVAAHMAVIYNLPLAEGLARVCANNNTKFQGDAHVKDGKLKKPSNHIPVVLDDLVRNKWGNFISN